jgi:uncharacterized protein (TIGR02466 family)
VHRRGHCGIITQFAAGGIARDGALLYMDFAPVKDFAPVMERREGDISYWWPTPIFMHRWPDHARLNAELESVILARMEATPGLRRSNVGGWHSEEDLLAWPSPAVGVLRGWVERGLTELIRTTAGPQAVPQSFPMAAWANVNRAGHSNDIHDHGNHAWAAVYYVATGAADPDQPSSGPLELKDPRAGASRIHLGYSTEGLSRLLKPLAGMMVIFPAWLWHAVRPHSDPGLRISIAFNIAEARGSGARHGAAHVAPHAVS